MNNEEFNKLIKELTSGLEETSEKKDLTPEELHKKEEQALRGFLKKINTPPPKEDEPASL